MKNFDFSRIINTVIRALLLVITACAVRGAVTPVPTLGLLATVFQLSGHEAVNNIKLHWNILENATYYQVFRSTGTNLKTTKIGTLSGNIFDDYDLEVGKPSYYLVKAFSINNTLLAQAVTSKTTYRQNGTYMTYDNTLPSSLIMKSNLESKGIYYRYTYNSNTNGFLSIIQQTSTNGLDFFGNTSVLSWRSVCASINSTYCKLECVTVEQNPATGNFVLWAHIENNVDYSIAKVTVAEAVPGRSFKFIGSYRPLGYDSRDLTFFRDTDGTGYLISTTNGNADLHLYKLTRNWTSIESLTSTLLAGEWREAPAMVYVGNHYYLFTSDSAGWYPSQGLCISSKSLVGPWSELREIGSTSTFGTQSGGIIQLGQDYVMMANRWAANWNNPEPRNSQRMLPITFNNGYATCGFYPIVKYNIINGEIIPVQSGRIMSIDKPSYSNRRTVKGGNNLPSQADDGNMSSLSNVYVPICVPFSWRVDLEIATKIRQIDISFPMVKGSETASAYLVRASLDGVKYDIIVNNTENTLVGFVTSNVTNTKQYRYIEVKVSKVTDVQHNDQPSFGIGLIQVLVFCI